MSRSERTGAETPLAHPLWWTALGLLVVNDHVLKGAGVLPGVVTGKVSDLAGMIVAPVLLVAIVRARTVLARGACFAAVAAVFAAIKLSGLAATWLAAALSLLGVPWRIWVDPTDLLALLALPVAWTLTTTPKHDAPRAAVPLARVAHVLGAALGVVACLASSGGGPGVWSTPAYIVNDTFMPLDIRLRYYDGDFSCADLDDFAPRAFAPSSFGEGITFHLAQHETLPLDRVSVNAAAGVGAGTAGALPPCDVVLLQADGMPDTLVWWSDLSSLGVPLRSTDPAFENDSSLRQGRIDIGIGGFRVLTARARGSVRTAAASPVAPKSSCSQAPAFQWSIDDSTFIGYEVVIASQTTLPDGCVDLELAHVSGSTGTGGAGSGGEGSGGDASGGAGGAGDPGGGGAGGAEEPAAGTRLVMCLPPGVWPFEAGDLVVPEIVGNAGSEGLRVRGEAGDISIYSAQPSAPLATGATGFTRVECEGDRLSCGAFAVPVAVTLSNGEILEPGSSAKVNAADGTPQQLYVGRAEDVLVTRDGCEPGRTGLGMRADLVVVSEGGSQ